MDHHLYIVSWNVTRRCNLRCSHCYLPAQDGGPPADTGMGPELTTGEALQLIDQIALMNPETLLILSGGEPLLREDLFELAEYASGKGMMVVVGSNGLLIDEAAAGELKRSGVRGVSISLDSMHPGIHDGIRSWKGGWERAVQAVNICRNRGLAVQINTTITKKNCEEIPKLAEFSRTLGAKVFSPFFLVCTGRGEQLADIPPETYEQILSSIVDSKENYHGLMIRTRCAPIFRRILYQKNPGSPLLKMDTGRCLAGLHYCRITPEGDLTPCPYLPLAVGNTKRKTLRELWSESPAFVLLRNPTLKGKCGICEFKILCGGCRARALVFYGDYMAEDPWCAYQPGGEETVDPSALRPDSLSSGLPGMTGTLWTGEAEEHLKRVPFFVRSMVRCAVERYALENQVKEITPEVMEELKHKLFRKSH